MCDATGTFVPLGIFLVSGVGCQFVPIMIPVDPPTKLDFGFTY